MVGSNLPAMAVAEGGSQVTNKLHERVSPRGSNSAAGLRQIGVGVTIIRS